MYQTKTGVCEKCVEAELLFAQGVIPLHQSEVIDVIAVRVLVMSD